MAGKIFLDTHIPCLTTINGVTINLGCSKISNTFHFLFSMKMRVIGDGIYKILVSYIANREDPDQTASSQSDLGLHCLSRPFCLATSVRNFRTVEVNG